MARPYKYTVEKMAAILDEYFASTPVEELTITGVCIALGINKDTFYEYCKLSDFKDITDMARLKVENAYENSLRKYGRSGDIFALKNFGWRDQQDINASINTIQIEVKRDED